MTTQSEEIVHSQAAHLLYKERRVEFISISRHEGNMHFSDYGVKLRYQASIPALTGHFETEAGYPRKDLLTTGTGKFHTAELHDKESLAALIGSGHPQQAYLVHAMAELTIYAAQEKARSQGWAYPAATSAPALTA